MLSQTERPSTFKEVAGQKLAVNVLRTIVHNPKNAPRSIILQGPWGTGKSTLSRIMAKALNCSSADKPCGTCDNCKQDILSSPFYDEYDSAIVGNVERIKELRDVFTMRPGSGYKTICLDEIHLASRQSQSALLKVIEETPSGIFFVFATTEVERIIPTIRSRSMEIRFEPISYEDTLNNLKSIVDKYNLTVSQKSLDLIISRSKGHMRDAHMLLDQCVLLGDEEFSSSVTSPDPAFTNYFKALLIGDKKLLFSALRDIMSFPVSDLKTDYEKFLLSVMRSVVAEPKEELKELISLGGIDLVKVIRFSMQDWIMSSFESDIMLQAALLANYQALSGVISKPPQPQGSVYSRHVKR